VVSGSRIPQARPGLAGSSRRGARTAGPESGASLFTQSALDYVGHQDGRAIVVLQAGCVTADAELDLAALDTICSELTVAMIDDDNAVTRTAVDRRPDLDAAVLADLRSVPLAPRSVDIVHCCLLLDRISHADIVLGRLVDALRPGGLLLLRTADRQSAAGLLDRLLPGPLRTLAWRSLRPGEPGPYPAIYEGLTSSRGIQAFVTRRGLVFGGRETRSALDSRRRPVLAAARRLVAAATRGRFTAAHDELGYVIRKPEDPFARVL
jgi:SAM-dependent methyltransferase